MSANVELEKTYDPKAVEAPMYALWRDAGAFDADPDDRPAERRYVIVIPPPNVTGALHLGHAINNTLQDILVRWHRMMGDNTLWLPGLDHAGIATQAVVERRILEEEGLTRHQVGREKLVERIWQWKDQYQKRIIQQLQLMGCSCDWRRTRFTLDDMCARAVRETFFRFFRDGLIYRGKRLVNWDTQLQTAVSDDEIYHETVKGHFWHVKYPVIDPKPGEPTHGAVATTRPETMLGDVAVAVHPDPAGALDRRERELRDKLATATDKERAEIERQLEAVAERRTTHLPTLIALRDMAKDGRKVMLPLMDKPIPLIVDEWADPMLGSGCVKITPAHDPNDYDVGQRQKLPLVNVMTPDGKVNENGGKYAGLLFPDARKKVVADLEALGLLETVEDREIDLGHSDRSKTPIEPYLSDQWFMRMADQDDGITLGNGSKASGLAQAAMDAVTDGQAQVFPERYARTYLDWLGEKRDWCISRQLWWGHRIPVWSVKRTHLMPPPGTVRWGPGPRLDGLKQLSVEYFISPYIQAVWDGTTVPSDDVLSMVAARGLFVCLKDSPNEKDRKILDACGFEEEEDVLDTWFSSALWPHSTLGWPEKTPELDYYYPGSVLITSRDIITLWVARMVLTGLYNMGEVPFRHVYIHPKILDGRGETMSKSKGNGVDPVDIIEVYGADALRYALADMTTETQDVRMPVEYRCPHCHTLTAQTATNMQAKTLTCHGCAKTFATRWADEAAQTEHGLALMVSDKFEIGRNFCNKLWNAARFAFMNLDESRKSEVRSRSEAGGPVDRGSLLPEDRWILARLHETIVQTHDALAHYRYSTAVKGLREFFWDSLCDWYIELVKPRLGGPSVSPSPSLPLSPSSSPEARQVLAFVLDQILRLFHPVLPFITERLWRQLNALVPHRGLPGIAEAPASDLLIRAVFPPADGWPALADAAILELFADIQTVTRGVRELRNTCKVSPKQPLTVSVQAPPGHIESLGAHGHIIRRMANIEDLRVAERVDRPANAASAVIGGLHIHVHDITDDAAERKRVTKELAEVEKMLKGKSGKLSNADFVKNAPPDVVQAERERLAELEQRKLALASSLALLG